MDHVMGPGFSNAVGALMLGRLIKFVVLPLVFLCIGIGLFIGWLI